MDKTTLGSQLKEYQAETDIQLDFDGYNILQLDGNAFHTFTRGFERPFDDRFMAAMNEVAVEVIKTIPGARVGFVQSDEISILVKKVLDREEPYFNHRVQKIVSLTAGRASAVMSRLYPEKNIAVFDARYFTVPDRDTAIKHFLWRQRDCTKNSILSVGQAYFSHKELQHKNSLMVREMLQTIGHAWEDYPVEYRHGRVIHRAATGRVVQFIHKKTKELQTVVVDSNDWQAFPAERFEESRLLDTLIP